MRAVILPLLAICFVVSTMLSGCAVAAIVGAVAYASSSADEADAEMLKARADWERMNVQRAQAGLAPLPFPSDAEAENMSPEDRARGREAWEKMNAKRKTEGKDELPMPDPYKFNDASTEHPATTGTVVLRQSGPSGSQTGEVITAPIANPCEQAQSGKATSDQGESFKADYGACVDSNTAMATISTDPRYSWVDKGRLASNSGRSTFGFGTFTGDRGRMIWMVFSVDPDTRHGVGQAKDNRGVGYSVEL